MIRTKCFSCKPNLNHDVKQNGAGGPLDNQFRSLIPTCKLIVIVTSGHKIISNVIKARAYPRSLHLKSILFKTLGLRSALKQPASTDKVMIKAFTKEIDKNHEPTKEW